MARISKMLNQYIGATPSMGDPWILQTADYLFWEWTMCLITWEIEPEKWWFHHYDDWKWYIISMCAVLKKDGIVWFSTLWTVIWDAMLDADMSPEQIVTAKKAILANIEYGIDYTIQYWKHN